ncbi:MAG: 60S ribosomal export protein NMD3 [Promethearchaeia archaeon]
MRPPCYLCGKPAVVEGLCAECYNEEHPLIRVDTPLRMLICDRCGAVKMQGRWKQITERISSPEELIAIQLEILLDKEVEMVAEDVTYSVIQKKRLDRVVYIDIIAHGCSHPELTPHTETHEVEVRLDYGTCDSCGMMRGGYHEAILQIRADDRKITKAEEDEILETVTDLTIGEYGKDSMAYITEISRTKYGIDIKIGSEHLCRMISDDLESRYLADRKQTYKLIGQESDGKEKYRTTILLRLPHFKEGDFVEVAGNPCQVRAMGKGGLVCYDFVDSSEFTVSPRNNKWQEIEFLASESKKQEYMVISKAYGEPIQLMNSETYKVENLPEDSLTSNLENGDKIMAVKLQGTLYYIPSPAACSVK